MRLRLVLAAAAARGAIAGEVSELDEKERLKEAEYLS